MKRRPAFSIASAIARLSAPVMPSGFSTKRCFPAARRRHDQLAVTVRLREDDDPLHLRVGQDLADGRRRPGATAAPHFATRAGSGSQAHFTRTSFRSASSFVKPGTWMWAQPTRARVVFPASCGAREALSGGEGRPGGAGGPQEAAAWSCRPSCSSSWRGKPYPDSKPERRIGVQEGIDGDQHRDRRGAARKIAKGLSRLLADTYTLYLKTHNFHWNVTGPMFNTLHLMFEAQYNELALAVDLIAERIRALGVRRARAATASSASSPRSPRARARPTRAR